MKGVDEVNPIKLTTRLKWSLYIISLVISLLRFILTYIDKRKLEIVFNLDLIYGSLLIISNTVTVFAKNFILKGLCFIANGFFLFTDTMISFFSYQDSLNRDFFSICLFFIIVRIFSVSALAICALFPP